MMCSTFICSRSSAAITISLGACVVGLGFDRSRSARVPPNSTVHVRLMRRLRPIQFQNLYTRPKLENLHRRGTSPPPPTDSFISVFVWGLAATVNIRHDSVLMIGSQRTHCSGDMFLKRCTDEILMYYKASLKVPGAFAALVYEKGK